MYLSPDADLNSGTSIYRPKTGVGPMITTRNNVKKREFNLGKLNKDEAEKFRIKVTMILRKLFVFQMCTIVVLDLILLIGIVLMIFLKTKNHV